MIIRRVIAGLALVALLGCSDNKSAQPPTATIPLQPPPKAGGAGGGKVNQGPNAPAPGGGASAF